MKTGIFFLPLVALLLFSCNVSDQPPLAVVNNVSDNYYGVDVIDPYRYMENMDDTLFLNWMKEYSDHTRKILNNIPGRQGLIDQLTEFDSRKSDKVYGLSISENGRYFYQKRTPDDETSKLFYRDSYTSKENLLYDPASFSEEEGVSYVISSVNPNLMGDKVGVSVSPNGSENSTLIIIDVETGKVLSDRIAMVFSGPYWLKDNNSFIYGKTNTADVHDPQRFLNTKIYSHKVGDRQDQDKVVYSMEKNPELGMQAQEIPIAFYNNDEDEFYLLFYTVERYLKIFRTSSLDISGKVKTKWATIVKKEDQIQDFNVKGNDLYLYTAKGAPRFQILKTSKTDPQIEKAETVVPEQDEGMISGFSFTNEAMYYTIIFNGVEEKLYRLDEETGIEENIKLPVKAGSIGIWTRGHKFNDIWVGLTGWTLDGKRYRYTHNENAFTPEPLSSEAEFPEFADLIVEELMIPSHDGVLVPLSVIYKKGTALDGTAPLIMSGYGAYGISQTPGFSPSKLMITLKGGIVASAHVRGGGELGDAWRLGGHKTTKPNTWKDLIACAEYLHKNNYTSPKHTAIFGGSAGGILIGRAMTERPDLFAAAIPLVGVMNPLRVEESPNGPVNAPEFGTVKDSLECMALIEMDSYIHIVDGEKYPATLVTAGFNDPRVIVWQPAKFAARLQTANTSSNPIMFDVDYSSGHGIGDTKTKSFEDFADIVSFALKHTGHKEFQ